MSNVCKLFCTKTTYVLLRDIVHLFKNTNLPIYLFHLVLIKVVAKNKCYRIRLFT